MSKKIDFKRLSKITADNIPPIEKTKTIGGMNMSSDCFWELFTETGDIDYYLLYLQASEMETHSQKNDVNADRAS